MYINYVYNGWNAAVLCYHINDLDKNIYIVYVCVFVCVTIQKHTDMCFPSDGAIFM